MFEEIPGIEMIEEDKKTILEQGLSWSFDEEISSRITCIRAKVKKETGQLELAGIALYKKQLSSDNAATLLILAVKNNHKRKGIGTACIDYLAHTTQCEKIELIARPEAVDFYRKRGFQQQPFFEIMLTKEIVKNK